LRYRNGGPVVHYDFVTGKVIEAPAAGTPTEAGAIGEGWWSTIVTRGRLYRLTGVWGLDKIGIFKDLSRENMVKYMESIKTFRKNLNWRQKLAIKHGIPVLASISKNFEEFQICLTWFEGLIKMLPAKWLKALNENAVKQALFIGHCHLFIYHPEVNHTVTRDATNLPFSTSTDYTEEETIVDSLAWLEWQDFDREQPPISLIGNFEAYIAVMQVSSLERTGIVFTPGVASLGLNVFVNCMNIPNVVLTKYDIEQLNATTPQKIDVTLKEIATQLKVDNVILCKLNSEYINTANTQVVIIDPAQIEAQIVEILKRFGITFDSTDSAKAEAAQRAYEAAAAIAKSV